MDAARNPFVPGAGTQPAKLAGRDDLLDRTEVTLSRVKNGRHSKSFVIVGLRGVGKTVLLGKVYEKATSHGFHAIQIEAHESKSLPALLVPKLRQVLIELDVGEAAAHIAKHGLRALAAFVSVFRAKYEDIEFGMTIDPELGTADSGDLETDLADLFEIVGNAARARSTAVAFIVDELQYLNEQEMSALIMAMHRIAQRNLPLTLIGGGLPQIVGLAGRSKSYAERLFDYPVVGALDKHDANEAISAPIIDEGATINRPALDRIYELTRGYPYFLQTWGHFTWNLARRENITKKDVDAATSEAIKNLDESFFRVRFDRLTRAERAYLFAMADIGPGPHRSGDIATNMKKKVESVAPTRSGLIKKGMVFSPAHGDTAFTVPMFDEYLQRIESVG